MRAHHLPIVLRSINSEAPMTVRRIKSIMTTPTDTPAMPAAPRVAGKKEERRNVIVTNAKMSRMRARAFMHVYTSRSLYYGGRIAAHERRPAPFPISQAFPGPAPVPAIARVVGLGPRDDTAVTHTPVGHCDAPAAFVARTASRFVLLAGRNFKAAPYIHDACMGWIY